MFVYWKNSMVFCVATLYECMYFHDEENNQQNALINSSINLLMSDHSDMFRLPS
jgi:hypothetical protein